MEKVRDFNQNEFGSFIVSELTKIDDLELMILKGHILTEFSINYYLEIISKKLEPNFFKENFTYNEKIRLLVHFGDFNSENGELVIKCLEILNKLRNSIAHTLLINNQLVLEILAILRKISPNEGNFNIENNNILNRLEGGISFICGIIFGEYCYLRDEKN